MALSAAASPGTPPAAPDRSRGGVREVFLLGYPVILSHLSTTLMGAVDAIIVGRLGPAELGAVGLAGVWVLVLFQVGNGAASGVQTFASQAHGAGRPRDCGRWAWHSIWLLVPIGVVLATLIVVGAAPLLRLLGPSAELQAAAAAYAVPRAWGGVATFVGLSIASFFRGVGDMMTPLRATIAGNIVNVVLTWLLVFGHAGLPALGVLGAGLGTMTGEIVVAAWVWIAFRRRRTDEAFDTAPVRPAATELRRLVRVGLPVGGQWALGMLSFALFASLVARMGDAAMAANQAFVNLSALSFMQIVGLSAAATTLVGRYIGERDFEAARRSYASAMRLAVGAAAVLAAIFVLTRHELIGLFSSDPEVIRLGAGLVIVGSIFQIPDAVTIVTNGALRGAGDTRWPFVVQTLTGWCIFLPLGYLFGVVLEGGVIGAWLAGIVELSVLSTGLVWRFRSGVWTRMQI